MEDKPHMCAVGAIADWWDLCGELGIERHGYVFRKRRGYNRVSYHARDKLVRLSLTLSTLRNC